MKSILVTGGAGFIGANFVPYFAKKYPEYKVINLDKLTYAGNPDNLSDCAECANYKFVQGDICDRALIVGTFTLLDVARNAWMEAPHKFKAGYEDCRFHHISTDEVYGALGETGFFKETTPYDPSSPYSASKASSDMLVRAYHRTYGMNVTVSNCSNNYGPKQHPEKLIPKIISNALSEKNIPIYGDGKNVRDWLYVLDHCKAIDLIFHKGKSGETYNIGGHNERNNLQIVDAICSILDMTAVMPLMRPN